MAQVKPQHENPNHFTAYIAGQQDYLNAKIADPSRYHIEDEYRKGRYMEGYEQETSDHYSILQTH